MRCILPVCAVLIYAFRVSIVNGADVNAKSCGGYCEKWYCKELFDVSSLAISVLL
ncbi:exported protein of unknown function [Moritella yayanosii]|uniref:Uncharacterized protein n=1 Tax=Moritella yayanosii TaxID=69539 RepID=A0A330LNR7_9GAMM|nr:exported protein of unknown function [Moritella yayanosii]